MEQIAGHDLGLDLFDQRHQGFHRPAAPVHERRVGDIGAHPGKDLVLPVERHMIVELRDQDIGEQVRSRHAPRDRSAGCRGLDDLLTASAGLLDARDLDDLQLRGDHVDQFADILTDHPQIAAAIGAILARVIFATFARRVLRDFRAAAVGFLGFSRLRSLSFRVGLLLGSGRRVIRLGQSQLQVFQRQFQLLDLAFDLFRTGSELLLLQFGNPNAQRLNQQIMRAQAGRHLLIFCLQRSNDRLQGGRIIGQWRGRSGHGDGYHILLSNATKRRNYKRINQPTRAGGAPQSGRLQSIPSHNMASCADVRRAVPSLPLGQGKRPRSSTL